MGMVVRMDETGGPDVLRPADVDLPGPGPGEVQVRQTAIGVNFVDIYHRNGLYPVAGLPAILGVEAAGRVEAVGPEVVGLAIGDRVAYAGLPAGSYAERRNLPEARLVPLPETVPDELAAASLLRGVTAHMLLDRVLAVRPGQTMLIHAAAGGVGQILTQWAKRLGMVTIGTVGSPAKAAVARRCGLDHVILYRSQDFVAATKDLTGGRGADCAVDGIGGTTLRQTLSAVHPFGIVASVGQAGGPIPPLEVGTLAGITLARPSVLTYLADPDTYRRAAAALFQVLTEGLRIEIGARFPLSRAADAHAALATGATTGSVVLIP